MVLFGFVWACADPKPVEETACPCARVRLPEAPVVDQEGLDQLLHDALPLVYPALADIDVGVAPVEELAYFRAWTELDTVAEDDGYARQYTVQYDPVVLADPPAPMALLAVVVHELGHVEDYVSKDSDALVSFALWYGTQDPLASDELRDYERSTDEKSLERGCAEGLSAFREWIAAHADPEILEEKQRNYYTPEEIAAWTDENGACLPSP